MFSSNYQTNMIPRFLIFKSKIALKLFIILAFTILLLNFKYEKLNESFIKIGSQVRTKKKKKFSIHLKKI